jgi:uncharacterized membrane protein
MYCFLVFFLFLRPNLVWSVGYFYGRLCGNLRNNGGDDDDDDDNNSIQ